MSISKNNYQGLIHCHSTHSYDGRYNYAELREYFLGKGLRFVCITEHIEYLNQQNIDDIIRECRENSDEQFVFVPGIEMDCFYIYFLGLDYVQVDFSSDKTIFDSLQEKATMCVFSHPIKAKYKYPDWLRAKCDGVEVMNTKHDGHHYLRPQSERLLASVQKERSHAVALAGMDFHYEKNFTPIRLAITKEGSLSEDFVINAIKNGDFIIMKGDVPLQEFSLVYKTIARLRILAMDFSHSVHKRMHDSGIRVPKGIKEIIRKAMEG